MICLLCLVLGIVTALPLIWDFLFILPWLTLPALFLISAKKPKPYLHGLCFFLGYYAVVWHWLVYLYPMDFAGFTAGMSVVIICLGIGFMSLIQSVGFAFVPMIYNRLFKSCKLLSPLAAASLWTIAEWAQSLFWFGIPWGRLALTQVGWLPMIRSVSLFGSLFIGFIISLFAGLIALALDGGIKKPSPKPICAALAIFLLNAAFGVIKPVLTAKNRTTFIGTAIQGNISSADKWADDSLSHSFEVYSSLTEKAVKESGAVLAVWPESVLTTYLNGNSYYAAKISALASKLGCDIIAGGYSSDGGEYNSLFLFRRDGTVSDIFYAKQHLVPFGEYVPMRKVIMTVFPFLADINMFSGEIDSGTSSAIMENADGKIGGLICFDSIYPSLARRSAKDGAELFVISTNDSWYGSSPAVWQHKSHAVLRAVENGKCVIRAANTGVSAIIDGEGRTFSFLGPLVEGYTASDFYYEDGTTLYTEIGDVILPLSALMLSAIIIISFVRKEKKR